MGKNDWHTMILHYLGLDHIGHTAGPMSPLVAPKLEEMDHIVEEIHKALIRWDQENGGHSLLVLCGDHGMSDSGSHGGASTSETMTPLVLLSSMFSDRKGKNNVHFPLNHFPLSLVYTAWLARLFVTIWFQ